MYLRTRIKQLLRSDAHALIKGLEDPKAILENSLNSMEDIIEKQKSSLRKHQTEKEKLSDLLNKQTVRLEQIKEEVDLCLAEDNDDLAKDAIHRMMLEEKEASKTREHLEVIQKESDVLNTSLKANQKQYEEIQLKASAHEFNSTMDGKEGFSSGIREEEVAIRLMKEKKARGIDQ